jgi:D-alanine-D-alanine ligase-like ATP-grasp enzyme
MNTGICGIVRGGKANTYTDSLATGKSVLLAIPKDRYQVRDIFIDQHGVWHVRGLPVLPARALDGVSLVWNALHNVPDEAGAPFSIFSLHGAPFVGSDRLGSALARDPSCVKKHFPQEPFRQVPRHILSRGEFTEAQLHAIFHACAGPVVVRGVRTPYRDAEVLNDVADLAYATLRFIEEDDVVLEPYLEGNYVSLFVIDNFRNEQHYTLPAVEYEPTVEGGRVLLGREAERRTLYPSRISREVAEKLASYARMIHQRLALRDFSETKFVVRPDGIFVVRTETHPFFGEGAPIHVALDAVGAHFDDVVAHVLERKRNPIAL